MTARPSKKMSKRLAQYSKEQDEYIDALEAEIKELREAIEVALGQSKDTTLRSSLIVMLMAETLEQALNKEK